MKTKLTFILLIVSFTGNISAYSQAKPNKEIFSSGLYEILWDDTDDGRLDNEGKLRN